MRYLPCSGCPLLFLSSRALFGKSMLRKLEQKRKLLRFQGRRAILLFCRASYRPMLRKLSTIRQDTKKTKKEMNFFNVFDQFICLWYFENQMGEERLTPEQQARLDMRNKISVSQANVWQVHN